jgi:hypothetical protein
MKIYVCGIARNVESHIENELNLVNALLDLNNENKAIIVTNDNHDDTDKILNLWRSVNEHNRIIINCDGLMKAYPERISRIAAARNFYLNFIRSTNENPDIIIVFDLDGLNKNVNTKDLINAIKFAPSDWVGLFPVQIDGYYDLYALRCKNWINGDILLEYRQRVSFIDSYIPEILKNNKILDRIITSYKNRLANSIIHSKQYFVPKNHPPIKVDSAFGGIAIYKNQAIQNAWYGHIDSNNNITCEHVIFHSLVNHGSLYIMPSLINIAPSEHLNKQSGKLIPF